MTLPPGVRVTLSVMGVVVPVSSSAAALDPWAGTVTVCPSQFLQVSRVPAVAFAIFVGVRLSTVIVLLISLKIRSATVLVSVFTMILVAAPHPAAKPRKPSSASPRIFFIASSYTSPQGSLRNTGPGESGPIFSEGGDVSSEGIGSPDACDSTVREP